MKWIFAMAWKYVSRSCFNTQLCNWQYRYYYATHIWSYGFVWHKVTWIYHLNHQASILFLPYLVYNVSILLFPLQYMIANTRLFTLIGIALCHVLMCTYYIFVKFLCATISSLNCNYKLCLKEVRCVTVPETNLYWMGVLLFNSNLLPSRSSKRLEHNDAMACYPTYRCLNKILI